MKKILLHSIVNLLNFMTWLTIVIFAFCGHYQVFLLLTVLSFTLSIFYLFVMWIYDIRLYISRNDQENHLKIKESKFYQILRERIFKYAFTINLTVCIGYWGLLMGGENIMSFGTAPVIVNLYVHLFIGVEMMLDLMLTNRRYLPNLFVKDFVITVGVIAVYSSLLVFIAKKFDIVMYNFLNLEVTQITAINMVLMLLSFNAYQFMHYILEKKHIKMVKEKQTDIGGEYSNYHPALLPDGSTQVETA